MRSGFSFAQYVLAALAGASCCAVAAAGPAAGHNKLPSQTLSTVATANDFCAAQQAIAGFTSFPFDNSDAVNDGPAHIACQGGFSEPQIDRDVWYCWTAPETACAATTVVSTCGSTAVDTKVAVYNGCNCPPTEANLLACGDDDCAQQTRVSFLSQPGHNYLVRIGAYPGRPGGTGTFTVACQEPTPCTAPPQNCQSPNEGDALSSNRQDYVVADDFTPAATGQVTSLCWWGAYQNSSNADCQGVAPDTFVVKYFADDGGKPGALVAIFSQTATTLTVQGPASTGAFIKGSLPEYQYRATHGAVNVSAGNCYWVEISNQLANCSWFWATSAARDERAMQDSAPPNGQVPNGYDLTDLICNDLAFCLSVELGSAGICVPPSPANDACATPTPLLGPGEFFFDNSTATLDGPAHALCQNANESQIDHDIWFCWEATCTGEVFARTCDRTHVDTRLAVYDGCTCPVTNARILACNDDLCDLESMVIFNAVQGQNYLIRLGTYPNACGGTGSFSITCGAPSNLSCPGTGSCCSGPGTPGCNDRACCERVCACDPFCCSTAWDDKCSGEGFYPGCGAAALCNCGPRCGSPTAKDCCIGHDTPFCSDQTCCDAVCACDSFCCQTEWDQYCATVGATGTCGATLLCSDLCRPNCPVGPINWVNPSTGVVDARRPFNPLSPTQLQGINQVIATGPQAADPRCWSLCETASDGAPNQIANVVEASGTYTVILSRPITPGAVTTITYTNNDGIATIGRFISHPADADGTVASNATDVQKFIAALQGNATLPWGVFSRDIDRSMMITALDILEAIDLLNGAGPYAVWNNTPTPVSSPTCP